MFCSNCGNEVDSKAVACPKCGVSPLQEKKFCYNCGVKIEENQAVCIKCGIGLPRSGAHKKKLIAGILGIVLGDFGIHKFYLGSWGWGIIYLLFCWTYIPALVGFIEGILYLFMDDSKFHQKYNIGQIKPFQW